MVKERDVNGNLIADPKKFPHGIKALADYIHSKGFRLSNENNMEIWLKPLDNDQWAMTFISMSDRTIEFEFDWKKHDIGDDF